MASEYRVTTDRRQGWALNPVYPIKIYRPTTLRARLWRWVMGG